MAQRTKTVVGLLGTPAVLPTPGAGTTAEGRWAITAILASGTAAGTLTVVSNGVTKLVLNIPVGGMSNMHFHPDCPLFGEPGSSVTATLSAAGNVTLVAYYEV